MTGIFKILFNLKVKSNGNPLEDYLTELFTYCLNQDIELLNAFLIQFCGVKSRIEEFNINTQYELKSLKNHECDSRPDMVLFTNNLTIFFENKINAKEGNKQLQRYAEHLNKIHTSRKILVYITRDYDIKNEKEIFSNCNTRIDFIQIRWFNIFKLLQKFKHNIIIQELLTFMKQINLSMNNQFTPVDILTLTNFSKVSSIMDETMFGEISKLFKKVNGVITQPSACLTQLKKHDRYVYYAYHNKAITIFLGFWMNSRNEKEYPEIGIEIELNPNSEQNENIRKIFQQIIEIHEDWDSNSLSDLSNWAKVRNKRSLQDFLSTKDHIGNIKLFFSESLTELESILKNNLELTLKNKN